MSDVVVIGVDMIKFGRFPEISVPKLGATASREGWMAIKAGVYDRVLSVGTEQMGKGLLGGRGPRKGIHSAFWQGSTLAS